MTSCENVPEILKDDVLRCRSQLDVKGKAECYCKPSIEDFIIEKDYYAKIKLRKNKSVNVKVVA